MTKEFLYDILKKHTLAAVSTVSTEEGPEAAVVGIAVTDKLEIIFDTLSNTRKYKNLIADPRIALVCWEGEMTLQYEGLAEVVQSGKAGDAWREVYFAAWPDGRERAANRAGLVHFKISPKWVRYSNFNEPAVIEEMEF